MFLILGYALVRNKLDPKYGEELRANMVRGRVKHSSKKEAIELAVVIAMFFLIEYVYELFR